MLFIHLNQQRERHWANRVPTNNEKDLQCIAVQSFTPLQESQAINLFSLIPKFYLFLTSFILIKKKTLELDIHPLQERFNLFSFVPKFVLFLTSFILLKNNIPWNQTFTPHMKVNRSIHLILYLNLFYFSQIYTRQKQ